MKKSAFTLATEKKLTALAPKKSTGKLNIEDYIMGNGKETSSLRFLGLTMPTVRSQLSDFSSASFEDMQKLWFESDLFEVKTLAIYWLDKQKPEFLEQHTSEIILWAHKIDNWAHSDGYCAIIARLFEHKQSILLPTYLEWNSHENSWLRRCSMVGTFYYSRARKKHPSLALAKKLVTPHLTASEYYVQKGVGWTIREMYNVYPADTVRYIDTHLKKLTPIAWVAASEKLPKNLKNKLLKKRKNFRQNQTA